MFRKTLISAATLAAMMSTVPAFADGEITASNAGGGTILFTGSVIDAPCSIKNQNINVDLGQVPVKKLKTAGATSQAQKIQIDLTDCTFNATNPTPTGIDHGLLSKVDVEFTGISHTVDAATGVIGNEATTDKANDVNIQLLRPDQTVYNLTTGPDSKLATQLSTGSNQVIFWAHMISKEGKASAGNVSASITYKLHYY